MGTKRPIEILIEIYSDVLATIRPLLGSELASKQCATREDGDATLYVDRMVESLVVGHLKKTPGYRFKVASEESTGTAFGEGIDVTVVIDPVDNTELLCRGTPLATLSVLLADSSSARPLAGLIGRLWDHWCAYADTDAAWLNGRRIRCSTTTEIGAAAIAGWAASGDRLRFFAENDLLRRARLLYNMGGCLEMAYVACGSFDAFVEPFGLPAWEYAAGAFIAEQAGARVGRPDGRPLDYTISTPERRERFVMAATPELFEAICESLSDSR